MTREEAIEVMKAYRDKLLNSVSNQLDGDIEALNMAISALEQEPCEEFINVPRKALKYISTNFVGYNVEWLKKHWQMEMDIVCGVKPCEDAISRQAAIDVLDRWLSCDDYNESERHIMRATESILYDLPPVTPKLRECDDAISREAVNTLVDELARAISDERCHIPQRGRDTGHIMHDILELPSVTPSRRKGHWLYKEITDDYRVKGQCSECKQRKIIDNFCSNCGAEMIEPQESEV